MAVQLLEHQKTLIRHAAWYEKDTATFADTIALLRRWLRWQQNLMMSKHPRDMIKAAQALFARLTEALSYAA